MTAAYDIYAKQLSQLRHGCPLWFPEPCHYDEVRAGDVGFIRDGVFHRLFNATKAADDPSNALYGVPENFTRLELPPGSIYKINNFLNPGATLHSLSVSKLEVAASANLNRGIITAGGELQFACSSSEGAVLVLTRRTIREDVIARGNFEKYVLKHFRSWYKLANERHGHGVAPGKMILVKGCDKTAEWASAVFSGNAHNAQISFTIGSPGIASGELAMSGFWQHGQSAQHRMGPACRGRHIKYDQTIFIRGYHVLERKIIGPKVVKAAAEPPPDPPGLGEDHSVSIRAESDDIVEHGAIEIEYIPNNIPDYDPVEALFKSKLKIWWPAEN